jgi:hypothetical protein
MAKATHRLTLADDDPLASAAARAEQDGSSVVVHIGRRSFRLVPVTTDTDDEFSHDELWQGYDATAVRAALKGLRGLWSRRRAEQFVRDTYDARHVPSNRPDISL